MHASEETQAPKKAINPGVGPDLLHKAREMDINLSATLEQALLEPRKHRHREQWLAENRPAIAAYNHHVERHGVFSDVLRTF